MIYGVKWWPNEADRRRSSERAAHAFDYGCRFDLPGEVRTPAGFSYPRAGMVHDSILAEWCRSAERTVDPSPDEIASMTAEIRAGWSDEERLDRLRCDWRPQAPVLPTGRDDELQDRWTMI